MFLKPTAKPTPRRTPSPRVVLPAPPGSRSGSRGSSSGDGGSSAAAARIGSAAGRGARDRRPGTDRVGEGERAVDPLPGGEHVAGLQGVQEPELDRIDVERR